MKKTILLTMASAMMLANYSHGAVGISGTGLLNATGLAANEVGVWVISDGTAFNTISITAGESILDSATYGAGFTVLGSNTAANVFSNISLGSGHSADFASFAGDSFAVFVFDASTGSAILSDNYSVWTDGTWALPTSDTEVFDFAASPGAGQIQQLGGAPSFSGTVIPEPSAALLGALGGLLLLRRRRNA